ncbi:S1 RNA-binding domain-containing protein [Candidatus Peregrinibacteria bacterium]|nr:MAG: S1 RNA-binding domain-containing protein [Candidatus Peregrinibacteria bacterium]
MSDSTQTVVVPMDSLLNDSPAFTLPEPGQIVEGKVAFISKKHIIVDLGGVLTGLISGREMKDSMGTTEELHIGDLVSACVLEAENEDGLVVLSLRRASQDKTWDKFVKAYEANQSLKVRPKEANKGGLLLEVDGIKGFIPVSQLAPLHYPRVNGADSAKILSRLQELIGQEFTVKIISIDKENGKLILSERAAFERERFDTLATLKAGSVVTGTVSGIVKFGIFVAFDGLEGLVHISEIAWGHVSDAHDFARLGDKVEVKIIGIEGDKISLSMKQLTPDPWEEIEKKYKIGTVIKTKISRLAQFGAFVQLEEDITGLIHNSEIPGNPDDAAKALEVGQAVDARVIEINKDEKRVGLSLLEEGAAPTEKKEKKAKKNEKEEEEGEEENA